MGDYGIVVPDDTQTKVVDDPMVNNPNHYQSESGMQVIDVIEEYTKDLKGIEATDTGNIIKYILRWKNKDGIRDLKKCVWYLLHLLHKLCPDEELYFDVKGIQYGVLNDKEVES